MVLTPRSPSSSVTTLPPRRQKDLQSLILKLGLQDTITVDWSLLDLALTHSTVSPTRNYEQLEFVGDAVVRLAAAQFLWEHYGNRGVGEFAAIRSILVSDRVLAEIAESYGFERYLLVGGSARNDRAGHLSRLADALEAVIAALYVPGKDLDLVRHWLDPHFALRTEEILRDPARQNYKAALQEWTQANFKCLPKYQVTETKPEHGSAERFTAQVWVQDQCWGMGTGGSIKAAEQAAARSAFETYCRPPDLN